MREERFVTLAQYSDFKGLVSVEEADIGKRVYMTF
jgi:hypothetical protein